MNRLDRIHVVNVRSRKDRFYVVLSDSSEVQWDIWIKMSEEERFSQ
jgi:hypothetical protein